jgi:hypothetical protein
MSQYDSFDVARVVAEKIATRLDDLPLWLISLRVDHDDPPCIRMDHRILSRDALGKRTEAVPVDTGPPNVESANTRAVDVGPESEVTAEALSSSSECELASSTFQMSCYRLCYSPVVALRMINCSIPTHNVTIQLRDFSISAQTVHQSPNLHL